MKRIHYILVAGAVMLTGCNKDYTEPTEGQKGTRLSIYVAVANSTGDVTDHTRATDDGYTKTFETDDAIGIYIYDGATPIYTNIKWIYDGTTWGPETPADNIYYNGTAMTIKAYFPHDEFASSLPEAATFTVQADQSTQVNYAKSDLLLSGSETWTGALTPLALTFSHAMGMIEVEPSGTADLQSVKLAAKISGGTQTVSTITLCPFGNGAYRALLPAQTLSSTLTFYYITDSYTYHVTKVLTVGKHTKFSVITPVAFGDYYYSDGTFSTMAMRTPTVRASTITYELY